MPAAPVAPVPLVIAHRGASKAFPENTLAAFEGAVRAGAQMVELDVRATADGALVVHHDPTVAGAAIVEQAAAALPPSVPSLADALDVCTAGGLEVNIEIKNQPGEPDFDPEERVAAAVVGLLRDRGDGERMLISSFRMETIDRVRLLDAGIRTAFLFAGPVPRGSRVVAGTRARGHTAIHPHHRLVTARLVQAAHAAGLRVNTWTVDRPERMQEVAAAGVDGICTNVPELMRSLFDHQSG